jgi:hypothetical protein
MKYKRKRLADRQIAVLYDCNIQTLVDWKNAKGLTGKINIWSWKTWGETFPKEAKKQKEKFLSLYNQGWKHIHIADEMDMTRSELTTFKRHFFPDLMRAKPFRLSDEQKKIAKENGIKLDTVSHRIRDGMDVEEAIRKPKEDPRIRKRGEKGRFL